MQPEFFERSFELDRAALDEKTRSVPVSFSSDKPVPRWFGNEILLHGSENVDLSQLKSVGSALYNHNPDVIIGPVKNVRLDGNKGRADIGFDDDEIGNLYMGKVKNNSLRGVSVRYTIQKFREIQEKEEWNGIKGPAYVATRWRPIEISLTPIPADASVGVNRSVFESIEIERSIPGGDSDMNEEEIKKLIQATVGEAVQRAVAEAIPKTVEQVRATLAEEARPKMRISVEEARDLTGRAAAVSLDAKSEISDMIFEGRSLQEIQNKLLDLATGNADARNTGGKGPAGSGLPKDTPKDGERKIDFEHVDDDMLIRSICNPSQLPVN